MNSHVPVFSAIASCTLSLNNALVYSWTLRSKILSLMVQLIKRGQMSRLNVIVDPSHPPRLSRRLYWICEEGRGSPVF